jgi:predicted GH43/DUF377 family glycosyl hydrolase
MTASLTFIDPAALAPGKRAFNNGICAYRGRLLMAYRQQPFDGPDRVVIAELDRVTHAPRANAHVELSGLAAGANAEDPRLFVHGERLWLSFTHALPPGRGAFAQQMYGALEEDGAVWRADALAPDYGSNRRDGFEKNWTFFESAGELFALYAPWRWEFVRIGRDGRCAAVRGKRRALSREFGVPFGGTPPMRRPDGSFLTLLHAYTMAGETRVYHVLAAVFEPEPPFALVRISTAPVISGSDRWPMPAAGSVLNPPWSVFPAGLLLDGKRIVASAGVNDCRCALVELSWAALALGAAG